MNFIKSGSPTRGSALNRLRCQPMRQPMPHTLPHTSKDGNSIDTRLLTYIDDAISGI